MTTSKEQSFKGATEVLDGRVFEDCTFTNCTLVYRGGALPNLDRCQITDCGFKFEDAAGRTLAFLKMAYHCFPGAGPQIVEEMFKQVRQPVSGGAK